MRRRFGAASIAAIVGLAVGWAPAAARAATAPAHVVAAPPANGGGGVAGLGPVPLVLAMAALALVPFALLMMTCFVRISVVLSILRSAIGAPQVPPTQVLTGLALVLTIAIMAPTGEKMVAAVGPVLAPLAGAGDLANGQTVAALGAATDRAKEPLRAFLLKHTGPR